MFTLGVQHEFPVVLMFTLGFQHETGMVILVSTAPLVDRTSVQQEW
jgi:hypothetical protein